MVTRTYTTGISLRHYPREVRTSKKKQLAAIIKEISQRNQELQRTYSKDVLGHLLQKNIEEHCIMDPLPDLNGASGKFGRNGTFMDLHKLYPERKLAANHLHSGLDQMNTACKGYVDRVGKIQKILAFMVEHPQELVSYILFQRSPWALSANKGELSFWYLDNLMRGAHHRYFGGSSAIPEILPDVSQEQIQEAVASIIDRMDSDEQNPRTDRQQTFINKLEEIQKLEKLTQVPTGWKNLKNWVEAQGFYKTYMSAFRTVLSQVYLGAYPGMNDISTNLQTAKVPQLLRIPFLPDEDVSDAPPSYPSIERHISYHVTAAGTDYVIQRETAKKSWEQMREQGYFELRFKPLQVHSWNDPIVVRIYPSRKMRQLMLKKVTLKALVILAPRGSDVDIQLIFNGKAEDFIATSHLDRCTPDPNLSTEIIGIDVNRRGPYAIVPSLDVEMPEEILGQSQRWDKVLEEISKLQSVQSKLISEGRDPWKQRVYQHQINALYRRKANLRKDYHLRLANWLGQLMMISGAQELRIEDLDVRTYGTRKALAKAVESMADDDQLYFREILAVSIKRNAEVILRKINPAGSSTIHLGCGGKLNRQLGYDIAPCSKCGDQINTHKNAALTLRSTVPEGSQPPKRS